MKQIANTYNFLSRRAFKVALRGLLYGAAFVSPVSGQQNAPTAQDCSWLENYVKDSSDNGTFPLGPADVTWAVGSAPDAPQKHMERHKALVLSVLSEVALPALPSTDPENAQVLFFFHTKKERSTDKNRILSELKSLTRTKPMYPDDHPFNDLASYNACSYSYLPNPNKSVGRISILIPFDRNTGSPIPEAKSCVTEGLLKAFGISLKGYGVERTGWTINCPRCVETDRRMAEILSQNNRSKQLKITVSQMLTELEDMACSR